MSDDQYQMSGDEPSLGGNTERTLNEPSLGGAEMQQFREALTWLSPEKRDLRRKPLQPDPTLFDKRIVLLTAEINDELANAVVAQLLYHDRQQPGENIIMIIESPGGQVYSGLAILDGIVMLRSPLITIGMGMVAGFAVLPLIAGQRGRRFITDNCTMAVVPLRAGGNPDNQPESVIRREIERLEHRVRSTIFQYTFITERDLPRDRDRYLNPSDAIRFGFADQIIDTRQR